MGEPLLRADGLAVRRGRRTLLTGLSFALRAGDAVHLAGANGSGKTSLVRVLAGLGPAAGGRLERRAAVAYALAEALAAPCGVLLLDEPFSGLDRAGRDWLAGALDARREEGAAIISPTTTTRRAAGSPASGASRSADEPLPPAARRAHTHAAARGPACAWRHSWSRS